MVTGHGSNPRFIDDTFSKDHLSDYHLSIQLTPDSASFSVADTSRDVVICVRRMKSTSDSMLESLHALMEDELLNHSDFRSASLAVDGVSSTLCPTGIAAQGVDPLAFSYGVEVDDVQTESIDGLNAEMRFALNQEVHEAFIKRFPQGQVHSATALLIASMLRKGRSSQGPLLFVDRSETFTNYFLLTGGALMLHNWFKTENEFDVLYHALNVCHQHGISEQEIQINLSGQVEPAGVDYRLLKEHFQKVDINFGLDFHKMGLGLSRVKRQHHLGLLNQYVCVS